MAGDGARADPNTTAACPQCGAVDGSSCLLPSGLPANIPHLGRTDRWRDYTTPTKAIADTRADPNRSYREDALLARIKQLYEALEAVQSEFLLDGYVGEVVETALHG